MLKLKQISYTMGMIRWAGRVGSRGSRHAGCPHAQALWGCPPGWPRPGPKARETKPKRQPFRWSEAAHGALAQLRPSLSTCRQALEQAAAGAAHCRCQQSSASNAGSGRVDAHRPARPECLISSRSQSPPFLPHLITPTVLHLNLSVAYHWIAYDRQ